MRPPRQYGAFMSNRAAGAVVVLLATVLLAGCGVMGASVESPAAAAPVVDVSVSRTAPSPSPTPTPTADADSCPARAGIGIYGWSEGDEEPIMSALWNGVELVDRGPREFATGTVARSAEGYISYTVASGDAPEAIAERLCTKVFSFENYFGYSPVLYAGDVIEVPDVLRPKLAVPWTEPPMQY